MMNARDARIIERVSGVAQQGLGQMTAAELNQGWERLAIRLAQGHHREAPIPEHLRSQNGIRVQRAKEARNAR
jgi:hypothetical protein